MDPVWDDNPNEDYSTSTEWDRISNDFTNAGYREGITVGKESALQEGFDSGFADVGAPLGRELGLLRGAASALHSFLSSTDDQSGLLNEIRDISAQLGEVRFSDIAPRDMEAEQHAKEHLNMGDDDDGMDENEEVAERRRMERLEDELAKLTASSISDASHIRRLTIDDVRNLRLRLETVLGKI